MKFKTMRFVVTLINSSDSDRINIVIDAKTYEAAANKAEKMAKKKTGFDWHHIRIQPMERLNIRTALRHM